MELGQIVATIKGYDFILIDCPPDLGGLTVAVTGDKARVAENAVRTVLREALEARGCASP